MADELALRKDSMVAFLAAETKLVEEQAAALIVDSDEGVTAATDILGRIAMGKKKAEERRKEMVSPLNEQV
ncbi:MAG: hypothetical protein ACM3UP_02165, partial [Methanocella sp.]